MSFTAPPPKGYLLIIISLNFLFLENTYSASGLGFLIIISSISSIFSKLKIGSIGPKISSFIISSSISGLSIIVGDIYLLT